MRFQELVTIGLIVFHFSGFKSNMGSSAIIIPKISGIIEFEPTKEANEQSNLHGDNYRNKINYCRADTRKPTCKCNTVGHKQNDSAYMNPISGKGGYVPYYY